MILRQTIWEALEKNVRLGFRKGCVIPEQFSLLLIKQKSHNKKFGRFKLEYFGGSDGSNKLQYSWFKNQHQKFYLVFAFQYPWQHRCDFIQPLPALWMFFVDGPRTETANLAHCEIVVYYTDTFVCLGFFANQERQENCGCLCGHGSWLTEAPEYVKKWWGPAYRMGTEV